MKRGLVTSSNFQVVPESSPRGTTSPHGVETVGASALEAAGTRVAAHLHGLLHGAPMFQPGDPQWQAHVARFTHAIARVFDTIDADHVRVFFFGEHVYVNGLPVRAEARLVAKTEWLLEFMHRLGIAEVRFYRTPVEADVAEFLSTLQAADRFGAGARDTALATVRTRVVRPNEEYAELLDHLRFGARFSLLEFYADALATTRVWARDIQERRQPDPIAARRLGARLVDVYASDPSGLLGMLSLRPISGSFASRRLDTTIVLVAIARELGLDDAHTLDFAVASLLRRVPDGWAAWWVRQPTAPSVAAALAFEAATPLEQVTSFEAAAPVGLSIPEEFYGRAVQPHAATMMLNVASGYVDLLQPGDASNPFAPEAALQMMLSQRGRYFEPTIVAALAKALGPWPPASIVRLNSGDVAVVVERARAGTPANRPIIRPVELGGTSGAYDLSRPELAAYRIVGSAERGDCAVNPMYVFVL